jgi:hypothetical protein
MRRLNPLLAELKKRLTNELNLRTIKLFFSLSLFLRLQVMDRSYFGVLVCLLKCGVID